MDDRYLPHPPADRPAFRTADLTALWLVVWYVAVSVVVPVSGAILPGWVVSVVELGGAVVFGLFRYALDPDGPWMVPVYTGVVGGLTVFYGVVIGLGQHWTGFVPVVLALAGLGWSAVARLTGSPTAWTTAHRGALVVTGVAAVAVPSLWSWRALIRDATAAPNPFLAQLFGATVAGALVLLVVLLLLRGGRGDDRLFGGVLAATAVALGAQLAWRAAVALRALDVGRLADDPQRIEFLAGTALGLVLFVVYVALLVAAHRRAAPPQVSPAPAT